MQGTCLVLPGKPGRISAFAFLKELRCTEGVKHTVICNDDRQNALRDNTLTESLRKAQAHQGLTPSGYVSGPEIKHSGEKVQAVIPLGRESAYLTKLSAPQM